MMRMRHRICKNYGTEPAPTRPVLVNRENGLETDCDMSELVPVGKAPDVLLHRRAAAALEHLMAQIGGWEHIVPVSGWRSFRQQTDIWNDTVITRGEDFARRFVALPGHSEHQTGLAIDLGWKQENREIDFICPVFPYTGICGQFRKLAPSFGFVERYPAGKEKITGISHEPWHFRYVGLPHSLAMVSLGLVLEEYILLLDVGPQGVGVSTKKRRPGHESI